ncbi:MAG: recombinase family protein, partial [Candidatus Saccharibacteria bacterium]
MRQQAIISCRVSTPEQRKNNSLNRQEESVYAAAKELDVDIPEDGIWSGSMSSKAGTNTERKDLKEMLEYCKKNRAVKYLIVAEPDRFMRSIDEANYFEVRFREAGVKVWYSNDPELNKGGLVSKLLKFSKYFTAEGSNDERITKSIDGHRKAISEGRYTFPTKPGYIKGSLPGVKLPHPSDFPPFQQSLERIASGLYTPSESFKMLMQSEFAQTRPTMKIDKFKQFAADPYYAGIIQVGKQIERRSEFSLHEAMITVEQHEAIKAVLAGNTKHFKRKKHNPDFPLANLIASIDHGVPGAVTGFNKSNGKGWHSPKYRSTAKEALHGRKVYKEYDRDEVHGNFSDVLAQIDMTTESIEKLAAAIEKLWRSKKRSDFELISQLTAHISKLEAQKSGLVRAMADPEKNFMIEELKQEFEAIKSQLQGLNDE